MASSVALTVILGYGINPDIRSGLGALRGMIFGSLIIIALGIYDDIRNASPLFKLAVQGIAGGIAVVMGTYFELASNPLADEVRDSMQLVEPDQWRKVFSRYVQHVNALRNREMVRSTMTGKTEQPDEKFIEETEAVGEPSVPTTIVR